MITHQPNIRYAKNGSWQTQRPALLPKDAALNPTAAAKRWGVYPFQTGGALMNGPDPVGVSGVTPTRGAFPSVSYVAPDTGQTRTVTLAELEAERADWAAQLERRGLGDPSDQGFEEALRAIIGTAQGEMAARATALLQMAMGISVREDKEEYQRLLFAGNTTDEVSFCARWKGKDIQLGCANVLITARSLLPRDFGTRMLLRMLISRNRYWSTKPSVYIPSCHFKLADIRLACLPLTSGLRPMLEESQRMSLDLYITSTENRASTLLYVNISPSLPSSNSIVYMVH